MKSVSASTTITGSTTGSTTWRCRTARKLALLAITSGFAVSAAPAQAMSPGDEPAGPTSTTEPSDRPVSPSPLLRIQVQPTINDATLLPGWITSRNRDIAEKIPANEGQDQWVAVDITGATYDYRVSVRAMRDGTPVGRVSEPRACVCNSEKLLAMVDDQIDEAVAEFRATEPAEMAIPPREPEPTPAGPPIDLESEAIVEQDDAHRRRLGALGYTGIALGVVGAGALGAGIPLVLRPDEPRGSPPGLEQYSTHTPGIALAVSGGVALAAGVTLLIVDGVRRRQRSVAVLPTFGPGRAGLSITRSF
jgi:hypothetical protein